MRCKSYRSPLPSPSSMPHIFDEGLTALILKLYLYDVPVTDQEYKDMAKWVEGEFIMIIADMVAVSVAEEFMAIAPELSGLQLELKEGNDEA